MLHELDTQATFENTDQNTDMDAFGPDSKVARLVDKMIKRQ